jgi:hypothetical protein
MTRPPPLAAAVALSLPPTTAGCLASLAPPDAPTFPPVAAAEAVVGLSLDAVAVAVGLPPLLRVSVSSPAGCHQGSASARLCDGGGATPARTAIAHECRAHHQQRLAGMASAWSEDTWGQIVDQHG